MIAVPRPSRSRLAHEHRERFLQMLPTISRVARQAFSELDAEGKEEATAEVVAAAFIMYVGLVRDGRESLAYASVLALYGVRRVRIGRQAATPQNVKDVSSAYCQLKKGVTVERLDKYDRDEGWQEVVVEDRRSTPAEIAACRLDFAQWLRRLPARTRRIARCLASGETTTSAARKSAVSPGRISQLRRELKCNWEDFQGQALGGLVVA